MLHAFDHALNVYRYVIIIGTDCPSLSKHHLEQAVLALKEGNQAVLIPAEDGGYVLLGLTLVNYHLFEGIHWGRSDVAQITRQRLTSLNWKWRELDRLWDIDRVEDLLRLKRSEKELGLGNEFAVFLRDLALC
jgi:glycosyltransferase A (GT-A) superfamily protein (DUF2064 family)